MNIFITLPSGLRINTAHIQHYMSPKNMASKTVISLTAGDPSTITEDMTAAELDALLQPQQSPIVSPVVNLDMLKCGAACQFTYEGRVKHGVLSDVRLSDVRNGAFEPIIYMQSDGEEYQFLPFSGTVIQDF